ncbi:MAG: nitrate reductase, partial [Deltaproteobacteria bacterium]
RPGTDLALLLAWMNVLVSEERYDKAYVERYGFGFEHFKARIAGYTPEWAYAETGIPPGLIRKTAREMAANAPATLVHPGRHVTWYGNDTQRSRAIALLNALLGSWGRKGGFYVPSRMQIPRHPHPPYPKPKRGRVDREAGTYPFAEEMLSTGIRRATLTGSPYPVKGWIVYGTNLIHSLPNPEETVEAIRKLDLLVVIDIIPSEIAGWADVILPEANYLERYDDLNTPAFREPFVSLRQPVVSPPGDQKPNWWIARALAGKLGLEAFFPWKDIEEYLQTRLAGVGLSLEELKRRGVVRGKGGPRYFEEGAEARFPTRSGKIEFYSVPLEEAGFDPVPRYTRPPA